MEIRNLSFSYGKKQIISSLSFSLAPGQCLVLAGPNGSGKSTLISLIAGILRPDSGEVTTEGRPALVPQGSALFEELIVEDNLRFFASLARCALPEKLPFDLDSKRKVRVSRLSGGQKKQLSIACALLGEPKILLLDEPCAALDIKYREELIALITERKAAGCSIIYAGHEPMEFVSFWDSILFLGRKPGLHTRSTLPPAEDEAAFCRVFADIFKSLEN